MIKDIIIQKNKTLSFKDSMILELYFDISIIFAGFKSYGVRVMKKAFLWITLFILLLVIISFFGIHPLLETLKVEALPREVMESVFADRYSSWHGIASAGYLLQCILGILLLIKMR